MKTQDFNCFFVKTLRMKLAIKLDFARVLYLSYPPSTPPPPPLINIVTIFRNSKKNIYID